MSTKRTDLPKSGHEQDSKERRSTAAETSPVHNSAGQAPQPAKRKSDLDHLQKQSDEDLKNMGFREADRK